MISSADHYLEMDVVPQAIIWRGLLCFSVELRRAQDDLDAFDVASFIIGNHISFDLRHYDGHPPLTVTLYVSLHAAREVSAEENLSEAISELRVPPYSVAWKQGQKFEFGALRRPPRDRIYEREARILALKIASQCPGRRASTEFIKREVPRYVQLSEIDLRPSQSRAPEQNWQQIVGNVISHRDTPEGPFRKGYAVRTQDGLEVTDNGVAYLKSLGFSA